MKLWLVCDMCANCFDAADGQVTVDGGQICGACIARARGRVTLPEDDEEPDEPTPLSPELGGEGG